MGGGNGDGDLTEEPGLQQDTWLRCSASLMSVKATSAVLVAFWGFFLIALIYTSKPARWEASERATGVIRCSADGWSEGISTSLARQKKPRDRPGGEMRWKRTSQLEKMAEQEGIEGPDSSWPEALAI